MNPRDRLLAALRGQKPDRVPLLLEGCQFAGRADVDALSDPALAEIARRIFEHTTYFASCPSHVNRYLVTPPQRIVEVHREEKEGSVRAVSEIDTPRGTLTAVTGRNATTNTVWTIKYPVESLEDIERIRSVPWELPSGLAAPDLSQLPPDFAERGVIHSGVSSPFVCVAGMMPYQYFLELCATEPALMRELASICHERIAAVLDALLADRTVEYVWMGGCEWLTPPMGSPRLYEELVQPFEADLISRMHAAGALCHIHCHGNVRSTLEMVIERGADFFEPVEPPPDGDNALAEAKAIAAGRFTLGGNIEARVLQYESVEAVEAATRAAFEGGKARMVLQTSAGPIGSISPTLLTNYHRMIDVWEECAALGDQV
ncbi:MAG: hypothetical protein JSV65_08010 [Armatimonadota bacterium]|nr:MAG: hypothetical protein JSV65_08010 [Armatimonadota bacterium]